ncbi:hypothetical protein Syun_011367 [Stephania yunnanensis]|uniref:ENTH domain-containing protein n=1 Tax=Stephania yunnanensis TaxID=152371 RepID=A0AAP0PFD3_9MAGN
MDFMKVLDQTVREIKREVNIKVLKVPEMEQKVLDATNNEAWGPHGSALAEIAQATKRFTECQLVMSVLWTRLADGGRNWRHVYKALAVIEYLIAHGSEKAVDDIIEHTFQISSLSGFEFVEPNGKDVGINVRKKSETIISLLNNKDKIEEVRNKAAANRDKYVGLSSSGISYKSSSASSSFGSNNFQSSDRYGGFGSKREGENFNDSYRDERFGNDDSGNSRERSRRGIDKDDDENNIKKTSSRHGRNQDVSASSTSMAPSKSNHSDNDYGSVASQSMSAPDDAEDDFDDFDPRGTSTNGKASTVNEVDLFGDFLDAPVPAMAPTSSAKNGKAAAEVDLFADATFVSAAPHVESGANSQAQASVNIFDSQPAFASASSATVDFFAAPSPVLPTDTQPQKTEAISSQNVDPFASMPLNDFDGSDLFGAFTSHTGQSTAEPTLNSAKEGNLNSASQNPMTESKSQPKKNAFQVKSGIWADSLSRGIIDLNISARKFLPVVIVNCLSHAKKTNLADIGIVGLSDGTEEKEKVLPAPSYMGRAMGMGSGLGISGFNPSTGAGSGDDLFSSLSQQQHFGSFKK